MIKIDLYTSKQVEICNIVRDFFIQHDISCAEDIWQKEDVDLDSLDFIGELFDVVKPEYIDE